MKHIIMLGLTLIIIDRANAQTVIEGTIYDSKKQPIISASVMVKENGTGTNTDSSGAYRLSVTDTGKVTLSVSSVGYNSRESSVTLGDSVIHLDFILRDEPRQLGEVIVSAGTFEASDKAKGASLTPMDAMTVAGNGGDIANSLRSLPGSQQVGEKEGLFVRGGTSAEAKQFVDGTLLKNPNFSSVPGLMQPARLNPFLFRGILFNTGAYSALYGDALSSALILETVDLPDESSASLHIFPMSVGAGIQQLGRNRKGSYGINTSYGDYKFYNKVIKQSPDYFHAPQYLTVDGNFRIKTSKTGMLKFYANYGYDHTGLRMPDVDSAGLFSSLDNRSTNFYSNLSYRESLGNAWRVDAGLAYNYNQQDVVNRLEDDAHRQLFIPSYPYNRKNNTVDLASDFVQARLVTTKKFNHNQAFRIGAEHFYSNDRYTLNDTLSHLTDDVTAAFAEGDIYIARNVAAKVGVRAEYSSLLEKVNVAPRLSIGYRLNDGGQLNIGYGLFYQKPELLYLVQNNELGYTRAAHYIVNYMKKANNRLLRIEAYYKKYNDLVTSKPTVDNDGDGYASGIEMFFRDKKTFKDFDYWVTYTYLDTKRKYLDYPSAMQPDFATPHTASVAIKRFFPELKFNANLSYAVATGRPYYNIVQGSDGKYAVADKGKTNMYSQANLSFAYLFTMFKKWKHPDFSGIGLGMNNVFGTKQIFGYKYSYNGLNRVPVTQPATRSLYIGIFMSFGIDRRDDFFDENL